MLRRTTLTITVGFTVVLIGWMSLATAARAGEGFDPYAGPPLNTAAWKTSGSGGMRCTDCLDARGYKDIKNQMGAIETDNGADSKWQLGLLTHAGATGGFLENPNLPAVITVVKSVDPLSDFVNNPGDPLGRDLRAVVLAAFAAQLKVTGGDVLPNPDAELVALFEESEVFSRSKFAFIQAWDSNQEFETESFVINDGGAANAALAAGDTVTGGPFIVREDYFETITDLTLDGNAVGAGQIEGATNSAEVRLIGDDAAVNLVAVGDRVTGWGIARTEEEARAGAKSAVSSTVRTNIASAFLDLSKSEQTDDAGGLTGSDLEGVRSVLATSSLNVFTGFETVSVIQVDIEGDKWFVVTISAQPGAIVEDGAASATSPSVSLVRSHPVTGVVTQTDAGADGTIVTQAAGGDGGAANAAFNQALPPEPVPDGTEGVDVAAVLSPGGAAFAQVFADATPIFASSFDATHGTAGGGIGKTQSVQGGLEERLFAARLNQGTGEQVFFGPIVADSKFSGRTEVTRGTDGSSLSVRDRGSIDVRQVGEALAPNIVAVGDLDDATGGARRDVGCIQHRFGKSDLGRKRAGGKRFAPGNVPPARF